MCQNGVIESCNCNLRSDRKAPESETLRSVDGEVSLAEFRPGRASFLRADYH